MTRRFSNSEVKNFKRCKRKWYLGHYRKLRSKATRWSGPLVLGTRIHAALEGLYNDGSDPRAILDKLHAADIEAMYEASGELGPSPDDEAKVQKEHELAYTMLEGFMVWVEEEGIDADLEIVATEQNVEAELSNGAIFMGRLDQEIRRKSDGAHLLRDWKTAQNLTAPRKMLQLDEQLLSYLTLLMLTRKPDEPRVEGGLYTMLRKTKRTARATPPFYAQIEVRHSIETLRNFYKRLVGTTNDILELEKKLDAGGDHQVLAYANPMLDCSYTCPYFAVCGNMDNGSDAEWYLNEYFEVHDPYERYGLELSGATDEHEV